MEVVRHGRVDLTPLLTHTFPLDRINEGYRVFGDRLDGVLKVAIRPYTCVGAASCGRPGSVPEAGRTGAVSDMT